MSDILKSLIKQFMPFAQKQIGFEMPPRLFLKHDEKNGADPLGKTAFYEPAEKSITLYTTGRHPKDILRSLGHELVHHKQNCEGKFDDVGEMGEGYAQTNPHLRQMEEDANRDGSMCVRDFEDTLKRENTIYFEHLQKGDINMSTKDWKNGELKVLLSEAWGFKMDLNKLNEGEKKPDGDGDGVPPWADKDDSDPDVQKEGDEIDRKATDARKTPWFDRTDKQHDASTAKHKKDNPGGIPQGTDYDPKTEKPERYKGSSDRMRARLEEDEDSKSELSESRLKEIIAYALKTKV